MIERYPPGMARHSTNVLEQLRTHGKGLPTATPVVGTVSTLPRVGSYARISDAYEDAETGVTEDGVKRQLTANRSIAAARSWEVADEYVDNDVSAFQDGVVRDDWERMLADLEAGVIDGIVCYNLDRFARRVDDLERAIAIYDRARKDGQQLYFATAEGDLNLMSDDGITLARVMVAFANKSSRDTSRRVKVKRAQQRNNSQTVSRARPFGWTYSGKGKHRVYQIQEQEADAIRWAADGLLSGSLSWVRIARDWTDRGLLTPHGKPWITSTVRSVMTSPRLAGWLVHKGAIAVHTETGELIKSSMPPILDNDTFEALLTMWSTPRNTGEGKRKYLLSGIARCAECGAALGGVRPQSENGSHGYSCRPTSRAAAGGVACGRVHVNGRELDSLIEDLVLPRIIDGTSAAQAQETWPGEPELMDLRTEKEQLLAAFREERAGSDVVFPAVTALDRRMDAMRAERAVWTREQRQHAHAAGVTAETWPDLDTDEKRALIAAEIEAVFVKLPTRARARTFEPGRVLPPVWRTSA